MPFCKYCGNEVDEDHIYCKKCGRRINSTRTPTPKVIIISGIIVVIAIIFVFVLFTGSNISFEANITPSDEKENLNGATNTKTLQPTSTITPTNTEMTASGNDLSLGVKTYEDFERYGWSVTYPASWSRKLYSDSSVWDHGIYLYPSNSTGQIYILVRDIGETLYGATRHTEEALESSSKYESEPTKDIITSWESTMLGGETAYKFVYKWTTETGNEFKAVEIITNKDGTTYRMGYADYLESFYNGMNNFEKVKEGFKITK